MQYCILLSNYYVFYSKIYILVCIIYVLKMGKYVGINIPIGLAKVLDEIVKKEGIYGSRAALVKHLIQNWIEEYRKKV